MNRVESFRLPAVSLNRITETLPAKVWIKVIETGRSGEALIEAMGQRFRVRAPGGLLQPGILLEARPERTDQSLVFHIHRKSSNAAFLSKAFHWMDRMFSNDVAPLSNQDVLKDTWLDRLAQLMSDLVRSGLGEQLDYIGQDETASHQYAGIFKEEPYMFLLRIQTKEYGPVGMVLFSETKDFSTMEAHCYVQGQTAMQQLKSILGDASNDLARVGIKEITVALRPPTSGLYYEA